MEALKRAIGLCKNQSELARRIGKSPGHVAMWLRRGRVPPDMCRLIEAATGGAVTRHELRPDVFDPPAAPAGRPEEAAA